MIHRLLLLGCLFFLGHVTLSGQNFLQEKRIYLIDVTASMEGKGVVQTPDIFDNVKSELKLAIESIHNPNTEIVIVPFTDVPHEPVVGSVGKRDSLLACIENLEVKKGDTNIADAWVRGLQELDSTRINYIFLLTDGLHNCGPDVITLYERLRGWQDLSANKYYFAFYVMLTPNAKEQQICQIVDSTNQMWLIESMNVNVTFIRSSMNIQANIKDNKTVKLYFTVSNKESLDEQMYFDMLLEKNPYYDILNFVPYLEEGYAELELMELKPLMEIPIDIQLKLRVVYDREKYYLTFFTPEEINFRILNRGIREISCSSERKEKSTLFDFGTGKYDEPFAGFLRIKPGILVKSLQYPPFSWLTSDTICLEKEFSIGFNNECLRSHSQAVVQFRDSLCAPVKHVKLYCNGKFCPNGEFTVNADSAKKTVVLKLVISPSAGKKVFNGLLFIKGKELDVVNGEGLQQDNNAVAGWSCEQEIGWPVLLWILWLVCLLLCIALVVLIIYGLFKLLLWCISQIKNMQTMSIKFPKHGK